MFTTRTKVALLSGAVIAMAAVESVDAQIRGHAVVDGGPIRVNVAFGERGGAYFVPTRGADRRPFLAWRHRAGTTIFELDRYLARLDREYELYRSMSPRSAYFRHGWTRQELRAHVRWLRQERHEVRAELRRLERASRVRGRRGR